MAGDKAHLYKDYATFTDVTSDHWAAGYINYCANAEWIAGYGNGKFGPNDKVTGYQAAAMILRAVGYGKNNEFKGSGWQVQAANFSRTLGLLDNVNKTNYTSTLNQPATRELVAEILFQAGLIPTVTWTPMNGYQPGDNSIQGQGNSLGLAWQNFKLNVGNWTNIDKWGRPGYYWYKNNSNTAANRVATIELEADLDLNGKAWKECDVSHELDIDEHDDFTLFVNNNVASTSTYRIESTDTVTNVGGQGRITEFYAVGDMTHPWAGLYGSTNKGTLTQRVVMIDTYLAKVTRVTERVLDRQGHVITPAYLYLDVYDGHGVGASAKTGVFHAAGSAAKVNTSEHRLSDKDANWAYVAGDMILVRGYSDKYQYAYDTNNDQITDAAGNDNSGIGTFANLSGLNHTGSQAAIEKSAFQPNCLLPAHKNAGDYWWDEQGYTTAGSTALEVVGKATAQKAESKLGKQTVTYWSEDKHTVDGTDYNDAMTLYLDVAGTKTGTTFAWYFDTFNNIIGIDNVPDTVNYGVIESIYSAFVQGENNTTGAAKAIANVKYADGSTGTITIDKFYVSSTSNGTWGTGAAHAQNTAMTGAAANTLDLVPVYDNSTGNVMTTSGPRAGATATNQGWLHVAPVTAVNAIENGKQQGVNGEAANGYFGVLRGNLYKFVASTDGSMTAIEVAGQWANNTGAFAGHENKAVTSGKLLKNLGYIDVTTGNGNTVDVRLDSDAIIMIRSSATSTAVACYNIDTLPGDVTLAANSEVDWADTNGNGRANYVYVTGTTVGTQTYGLFYYNGGAAVWNGVDKTGTLTGWLNGDPATLTFQGETTFTAVRDSQAYAGHLFAVELTNGVVSALMRNGATERLLNTAAISAVGPFTGFTNPAPGGANFKVGTVDGNPYNADTEAVYIKDVTTTPTGAEGNVTYNTTLNTVDVAAGTRYFLNPNSKVVGLGMGVTEDGAILDYLNKSTTNDVTIVYDKYSKAIVEIYVATDPNVTPSDPTPGTIGLTIGSIAHSGGKFTVNVISGTALANPADYDSIKVSLSKWNGAAYVPVVSGVAPVVLVDLTTAPAGISLDVTYAATSADGTYAVTVQYLKGTTVVAQGSGIVYCA